MIDNGSRLRFGFCSYRRSLFARMFSQVQPIYNTGCSNVFVFEFEGVDLPTVNK